MRLKVIAIANSAAALLTICFLGAAALLNDPGTISCRYPEITKGIEERLKVPASKSVYSFANWVGSILYDLDPLPYYELPSGGNE